MIKRLTLSMTVIPMAVIAMLLATSTVALAAGVVRAEAELAPIGNSGITAEISFVDDPVAHTLTIKGEAEGLNPKEVYFSLLYNTGSPSVGPLACEPTNNTVSFIQMLVGFWDVNAEGEGTISTVNSMAGNSNLKAHPALMKRFGLPAAFASAPAYVAVQKVGTVSVRQASSTPRPFELRACGDILIDD